MQTVLELLIAARERISDPSRWCQHTHARDASGEGVAPQSAAAVCWCSVGALYASIPERTHPGFYLFPGEEAGGRVEKAVRLLRVATSDGTADSAWEHLVEGYNDSHSHEEVMALWDKAIDLARSE